MSEQPPSLSKGLFGYRRSSVKKLLSDREVMLRQAEGRVRAAEAKASRLESEMSGLQEAHAKLQKRLDDLSSGRDSGPAERERGDITTRFLNEELATILGAAEQSATRIIERARASTEQQVAEAQRVWLDAQSQISRFAEWRERVDPALQSAQGRIEEVRNRIEQVPDQIRLALAPLADSVASLDSDLAEVSTAGGPPLPAAPAEDDESEGAEEAPWASEEAPDDEAAVVGFEIVEVVDVVDVDPGATASEAEDSVADGEQAAVER